MESSNGARLLLDFIHIIVLDGHSEPLAIIMKHLREVALRMAEYMVVVKILFLELCGDQLALGVDGRNLLVIG